MSSLSFIGVYRRIITACLLLTAVCLDLPTYSQELKLPRGTVCWPLNISGITLGINDDSEVQRLLGKGIERKGEIETAGRYFVDEAHTATLHVISYTDFSVGEVALQAGVDPAIRGSDLKHAESKWFKPADGFMYGLQLGSSKEDVLKKLGAPKKRVTINDWRYETICKCELPEYFDLFFKDNKVVKVVFSALAG